MDEQAGRNRKRRGVRSLWPLTFRRPDAETPEVGAEPTHPGVTVPAPRPVSKPDDATMRPSFFTGVTNVDALARGVASEPWEKEEEADEADRAADDRELWPRRATRSESAPATGLVTALTDLHAPASTVDTVVTELATVVATQATDAERRRASLAQLEMMPLYEADGQDADPVVLDGGGVRLALENRVLSMPWPSRTTRAVPCG
jgi:hypothetical protein